MAPLAPAMASRPAAGFDVAAARAADDPSIRQLLRETSFGTDVAISLEREPDSALAAAIEGDEHVVLVARHRPSGAVAGVASRSVRDVFVNGAPARVGYLGQLRIDDRFRQHRGLLAAGFEYVRALQHRDGSPQIHLASVVADNAPARRLLARRTPGWPVFEPVDRLASLAIPTRLRATGTRGGAVLCEPGSPEIAAEIVACLQRHGARFQFSPRWSQGDLASASRTRDLSLRDFVVARRAGRIAGCLACWDQRAFKQVVVRQYSARLARWRPLVNLLSPLTRIPPLPPAGSSLQFAYLSHLAIEHGESDDVAIALVEAGIRAAARRGLQYVVIGLSAGNPLLPALGRAFRHRAYHSILYAAFWPEGERFAASLDGRPSHPELAIL